MDHTYTSNDLVQMGARVLARVDQGIQALDRQLGAAEAEQRTGRRGEPEGSDDLIPLHLECRVSFKGSMAMMVEEAGVGPGERW